MDKQSLFTDNINRLSQAIEINEDLINDLMLCKKHLNKVSVNDLSKDFISNFKTSSLKIKKRNLFSLIGELFSGISSFPLAAYNEIYSKENIFNRQKQLGLKYPFMNHDAYTEDRIRLKQFNQQNLSKAKKGINEFINFYKDTKKELQFFLNEKTKQKVANVIPFISFSNEFAKYADQEIEKRNALKSISIISRFLN